MPRFTKAEYKNIAKALIAVSGISFDAHAFTDCGDLLTEDEQYELLQVIYDECYNTLHKLNTKLDVCIPTTTTKDIIEAMYFNDED